MLIKSALHSQYYCQWHTILLMNKFISLCSFSAKWIWGAIKKKYIKRYAKKILISKPMFDRVACPTCLSNTRVPSLISSRWKTLRTVSLFLFFYEYQKIFKIPYLKNYSAYKDDISIKLTKRHSYAKKK